MKEATGTVTAYVELAGQGAYGLALDGGGRRVSPMSQASPTAQSVAAAHRVQSQVVTNAQSLAASSNSQVLYTTHNCSGVWRSPVMRRRSGASPGTRMWCRISRIVRRSV